MPAGIEPKKQTAAAPALAVPKAASRRVLIIDRVSGMVIRLGGEAVILAVAAIFFFITRETVPLFRAARVTSQSQSTLPASASRLVAGMDEYETYAYFLGTNGVVELITLDGWQTATNLPVPQLAKHPLSAAYRAPSKDYLFLGTRDGQVLLAQLKFDASFATGKRVVGSRLSEDQLVAVSPTGSPVTRVFGRRDSNGKNFFAAACADGKLYTGSYAEGEDAKVQALGGDIKGGVTSLAIDGDGRKLFAATDAGDIYQWMLEDSIEKPFEVLHAGNTARPITAMDFSIGNNALLLGFKDGSVEQWFGIRERKNDSERHFRKIRSFEPLDGAVTSIAPSGRDKGFLAGSERGQVRLYFTTSGRTLLALDAGGPVASLCYAPKLTSALALTGGDSPRATQWGVYNPHPEISWSTLFGKVWYEGYDAPEYIWQSSGGSDDFESKMSLVPLTFGTLKGAFYGLLFAVPIAVVAALYASQFMSHRVRAYVKPTVEIMAALPSVVVGFLAGLWLAPLLEDHMISLALALLIIPLLVLILVLAWNRLPTHQRARIPAGLELLLIIPAVILGFFVAVKLGQPVEAALFKDGFKQWVFTFFGQQFEQRNSIVIGFAMAFAVIPIIFTISDDALTNVPSHFVSGSLALGASRWQTAVRVILPTASPGIFSAIMIGFGRAVGETMIVLMATGNTPIMSLSPFNGMRTLSANIAVEIPEAPAGGTLYRVLFLAAVLLFVLTFVVNTVAEIIRHRLREKYKAV